MRMGLSEEVALELTEAWMKRSPLPKHLRGLEGSWIRVRKGWGGGWGEQGWGRERLSASHWKKFGFEFRFVWESLVGK